MEKEESNNYSAAFMPSNFNGLDYTLDHNHHHHQDQQQLMNSSSHVDQTSSSYENNNNNNNGMVNYLMNNHHHDQLQFQPQQTHQPAPQPVPVGFGGGSTSSFDKLSFADVMQFADFGPKLALNQTKISEEESGMDPVYFLKFPVLNNKLDEDDDQSIMVPRPDGLNSHQEEERYTKSAEEEEARGVSGSTNSVQLRFLGEDFQNNPSVPELPKNKRKRPRSTKTSQEVESQRMTHIAVERNRRKQMNEHLRVLRSLMPGSYVQRGDQASIIGGAIDFVRELEQLLQCLESQKRRRLLGEAPPPPRQVGADSAAVANMVVLPSQPAHQSSAGVPFIPSPNFPINTNDPIKFVDFETGLREETAENKSCFADVEVKVLGVDAMIKILSQRRPGQLIKAIAGLEDLQLSILHTNITTIEQTVLYCFNAKVGSESSFTAEDIASSVQQIFSFIHANTASM